MEAPTPEPAVRPLGLHEFVLEVADLDRSAVFYERVIGLPVVTRWEGERSAVWFAMGDSSALGLWPVETGGANAIAHGRGGEHVHFALRIPRGTIDTVHAHLEAMGYAVERVAFDNGNESLYLNDPDGHLVELMDAVVSWSGTTLT